MSLIKSCVFEYIPFETLVKQTQNDYNDALKASDHAGSSTLFIEYMLAVIDHSLDDYLEMKLFTKLKSKCVVAARRGG